MKRKYKVTNMMCASCVSHVQKAVEKIEGVNNVEVNLLTESMVVDFDESKITDQNIITNVLKEGYGCSIYKREIKVDNSDIKKMIRRIIVSSVFLVLLLYVSMGHMINLPLPRFLTDDDKSIFFALTQIILLFPIVILNFSYFKTGYKKLVSLKPNMDSLIAIGATASIVYGIFATIMIILGKNSYRHDLYFESAGTILTLITIGKFLETKSKKRTTESLEKIMALTPKTALIELEGEEKEINQEEIKLQDTLIIKAGMIIPVDGTVIYGLGSLDEAIITGESMPVEKTVSDKAIAGSKLLNGFIKMKAESINGETTIDRILDLVEEAASSKAPISRLADKISAIFVPVVFAIAILSSIVWLIAGKSDFALNTFISVLVISCPCALGLATPVAIMVGTGKAAENNILVKSAESLELCHKINAIVLDKTGTITSGKMSVNGVYFDDKDMLKNAYSLEKKSTHPLSIAICEYASKNNAEFFEIDNIQNISGQGIMGEKNGHKYYAGNLDFLTKNNILVQSNLKEKIDELSLDANTVILIAEDTKFLGLISIKDEIRENSIKAIKMFKEKNIEVYMATGDNDITAKAIASKMEIDQVFSKVNPEEKANIIKQLADNGKVVAFVGDGINDAVALTTANVGIAIGAGTDVAISSADVVLPSSDLIHVNTLIDLSRKTINNIKLSLFWAFFYNCIGIVIATGMFFPLFEIKLNPMIASLAMSLSSFCVVLNALRLKLFKNNK